jgi:hypothetical protein
MERSVAVDTTPGVPIPNNNQFNLLLIGVDNIHSKDAKLQSIWILAFPQKPSRLNLFPVFPSMDKPVQNLRLAEAFHLHRGQPSQEFWNLMKGTDTWWNEYVVSDKTDLTNLVDSLQGIQVAGEYLNGIQALSKIPSWKSDPQMAIKQQKIVFEGVCNRISATHLAGKTNGTFLKTINPSKNTKLIIGQWIAKIAASSGLGCYFPTFEEIPVPPAIVIP